jgi:hypothetical protein
LQFLVVVLQEIRNRRADNGPDQGTDRHDRSCHCDSDQKQKTGSGVALEYDLSRTAENDLCQHHFRV